MANSMTGFGSAQGQGGGYRWSLEVRSVNARGLDIRTRLPDGIEGLEKTVRDKIAKIVSRGNISAAIRLFRDDEAASISIDANRISAALDAVDQVQNTASERGIKLAEVRATDILAIRGVMESSRDQGPTQDVVKLLGVEFDGALESFRAMRAQEGAAVAALLSDQVDQVNKFTDAAEKAAGSRTKRMKSAIQTALKTITGATDTVDAGRVEAELAMIAVKVDVTEEIDRLRTHVAAARALLNGKGPVGRKLDFLTQEFNREANTLCSKAQSAELTAIGLDLKAVIDQMREQVQNLE